VVPFGQDDALTARVRRVGELNLLVTPGRTGIGEIVRLNPGEHMELSWQADGGFRSVEAALIDVAADGL
jgi:hypothetical protein